MKFGKFEKTYPITKLEDSGPIEFLIENATDHSLGMRQSYLHIKFKVANSDGSNLAADTKADLVNYSIASLLQQVDVFLMEVLQTPTHTESCWIKEQKTRTLVFLFYLFILFIYLFTVGSQFIN